MIEACRRGPPGARVDAIEEREADAGRARAARRGRFSVLPTV